MHSQDLQQGNGFMGALTRQVLLPPHKQRAPFGGGYGGIPRRDGNWGTREEHKKYIGDNSIMPGGRKIISPHFEDHAVQNWRLPPDRSVTIHEMGARGRSPYRSKLPGLKTADLSHRLRCSPRESKKPIFVNQSSPRPPAPQRINRKISAKDRLTLPAQTPPADKKSAPRLNRKRINISKSKHKPEVLVKSSTQNDPRIRSNPQKTDIPIEPRVTSIDNYLGSVRKSLSPNKSPILTLQYFDEETSLREERQTEIQETFDVPLPPQISPKSNETNLNDQQVTEENKGNTKDSFWDETDDCLPVITPIHFSENVQESFGSEINPRLTELTRTEPSELILSEELMDCNPSVNSSFFDDEISSNANQQHPTNSLDQNSMFIGKQSHSHHRNAIKQKRRDDKLKRYNRKELANEDKIFHSKSSHIKLNSHSHTKQSKVNIHHTQKPNSSSPIIKFNTQSHIRLKKTVNLADHESEHTSSEEETDSAPNLYVPLPTSPLAPLHILSNRNTPVPLQSSDISIDFSVPIDFGSIQSQDLSIICTRDDTAIGYAVEVEGTPFVNTTSRQTNKPSDTKDIHESLEQRPSMLSESSDIGLQIEYVSDDVIAKSPVGLNIEVSTDIPKITELPSLLIQGFKSASPKCEIETPDSVFTPGFSCSHHQGFSIDPLDSPFQSLDSSAIESEGLQPAGRDTEKYRSGKRKSTRRSKQFKPTTDPLVRTESDHSFNSTREVCIPLTKLNVSQYGCKAKSQPTESSIEKEKQTGTLVSRCMFCNRSSNQNNLGFLFGPFHKRGGCLDVTQQPVNARLATREFNKNEMWVHAPCALWSPGVLLVSFKVDGLVDAYESSRTNRCQECGETGATLPCHTETCTRVYHYTCAVKGNCSLTHNTFQLLCPSHTIDTAKDF